MEDDVITAGKRVSFLVQEQLQFCRHLQRVDLISAMQEIATDEECLKKANSLLLLLKADVRAFNACASRMFPPFQGEATAAELPGCTDEATRSAHSVETVERLLLKFRHVHPADGSCGIKAASNLYQLVNMRERMQEGLTSRLLELKADMDKECGTSFVDIETYLRTEKDKRGSTDVEHCSPCAKSFVELLYKFQAMLEACRGLRSAKEGLSQTASLKALRGEKDALASRLGDAEAELKQIHQGYNEIMTPEMATGLENRQRRKLEEQEADMSRLRSEVSTQARERDRLFSENGRLLDAMDELQSQLTTDRERYERQLAWLTPKVTVAEERAVEIEGLLEQLNLKLSLLRSSQRKAAAEIRDLKTRLSMNEDNPGDAKVFSLREELRQYQDTIGKLESEGWRKDGLLNVALTARAQTVAEYRVLKEKNEVLEDQLREMEVRCRDSRVKAEQELEGMNRRLSAGEVKSCQLEGEASRLSAGLRQAEDDLHTKRLENGILQQRLDEQEMQLRDHYNLQRELAELRVSKDETSQELSTTRGNLEALKTRAIDLGMAMELGLG